ncbi:hypothetical protein [Pseudarthrobacter sp. CCNWLW207]|uniref:hypothetical protein n=1 Tax=Pseudarthrobacter sp. CCNWLW207 TaxID=3127468 RepID=UPI003078018C
MTVNRGPGVAPIAGVGTTTVEHRLQLAGLYAENAPGVPRSGVLGQATDQLVIAKADWSYDIGPAPLVINRTAGEGVYTPTLTGTTNVATDAAPGSNSRWDLIYVKQNDQAKGDADNEAVIDVVKGTAAASPTKPTGSLPAGAYVIAEARIFAGTTGTSDGSNTVTQVWRHTAARGARITIRNATERAEITAPTKGQEILRTDMNQVSAFGTVERWNGTGWDHLGHSEWTFSVAGVPSATVWGSSTMTNDAANTTDTAFVTTPGTDRLTLRDAGTYAIDVAASFGVTGNGRSFMQLMNGATNVKRQPNTGEDTGGVSVANYKCAANTTLFFTSYISLASGTTTWAGRVRVTRIA